jgi:hypothetical protein
MDFQEIWRWKILRQIIVPYQFSFNVFNDDFAWKPRRFSAHRAEYLSGGGGCFEQKLRRKVNMNVLCSLMLFDIIKQKGWYE